MASLHRAVTTSSPVAFGFGHPTLFFWLRAWSVCTVATTYYSTMSWHYHKIKSSVDWFSPINLYSELCANNSVNGRYLLDRIDTMGKRHVETAYTTKLWYLRSYTKFRSALTRLGGADAVVLQWNCVRRTCSRSLNSNCLGRGSNPYPPCYRTTADTGAEPQ